MKQDNNQIVEVSLPEKQESQTNPELFPNILFPLVTGKFEIEDIKRLMRSRLTTAFNNLTTTKITTKPTRLQEQALDNSILATKYLFGLVVRDMDEDARKEQVMVPIVPDPEDEVKDDATAVIGDKKRKLRAISQAMKKKLDGEKKRKE